MVSDEARMLGPERALRDLDRTALQLLGFRPTPQSIYDDGIVTQGLHSERMVGPIRLLGYCQRALHGSPRPPLAQIVLSAPVKEP
jgi:hypothetical protein